MKNIGIPTNHYWIIPGNVNIFRVTDYFNEHDIIDWKQSHYKFMVGDIVFLYVSKPMSCIRYMLEVVKCDIPYDSSINDEEYWTDSHEMAENVQHYRYVRLKLLKTVNTPKLHLHALAVQGMSVPQGATRNLSRQLIDYILEQFS